ncbi:putative fasciclin-like arabinogalactan protein 20 [Malania oleifera]|uniref:putative fasciclin-like arabinogalactan protein 20 n=1 Tax=Malania oleifera TaxID=397392 RepID=UPI0025ADA5FF|nr:putative fasciclin-like arabinogalactan protein 20 [Malania oleifera]
MAALLLFYLILLSALSLSSSLSSQTIQNAAAVLSDAGFDSMALTLQLASDSIIPSSNQTVTIFSPSDSAFAQSGQPSLSLLQFHFSPLTFSLQSLQSLPFGTRIPTMFPGHSLAVTTTEFDDQISLNNVSVDRSPIYNDHFLIIYGIHSFFDLKFELKEFNPSVSPIPNLDCIATEVPNVSGSFSFDEPLEFLRLTGYSVMASFLDLQLMKEFKDQTKLTIFAPIDGVMINHVGNFSEYSSLFLRHVLPCKLKWTDLGNSDDGTKLPTFLEAYTIDVTKSGDAVMLNGIPIVFPDMYFGDWLVVHGLHEILPAPETPEHEAESLWEIGEIEDEDEEKVSDREEF